MLFEIQQNSDTTYRVFDWNRTDEHGSPRALHIKESLRSIDFADYEPELVQPAGESLVAHSLFALQKWSLTAPRELTPPDRFAIVACLTGRLQCAGVEIGTGEFFLAPAAMPDRMLRPLVGETTLLHITA